MALGYSTNCKTNSCVRCFLSHQHYYCMQYTVTHVYTHAHLQANLRINIDLTLFKAILLLQ